MAKSDKELGSDLWPGLTKAPEGEQAAEKGERPAPLQGLAADEAMAAALYPPRDPRFPREENGRLNDAVRDTSGSDRGRGRIIAEGSFDGRIDKLVQHHAALLDNADLSDQTIGLEVRDGSMRMADFADAVLTKDGAITHSDLRGSDWRGAQIHGSLAHSDLRGADFNSDTDIAGGDFLNVKLDAATFERLRGCKGFDKAVHLMKPIEGMQGA